MPDNAKPDYTTLTFPDPPPDRPYVYVNIVISTDGRVTDGKVTVDAVARANAITRTSLIGIGDTLVIP